jgi:hypothetical protein
VARAFIDGSETPHAQALLKSTPQGATDYLQADLRDPGVICAGRRRCSMSGRPAAVLLLGVLHLIQDSEDPRGIVGAVDFRGDGAVTTWLHRIVVNASLDRLRGRAAALLSRLAMSRPSRPW